MKWSWASSLINSTTRVGSRVFASKMRLFRSFQIFHAVYIIRDAVRLFRSLSLPIIRDAVQTKQATGSIHLSHSLSLSLPLSPAPGRVDTTVENRVVPLCTLSANHGKNSSNGGSAKQNATRCPSHSPACGSHALPGPHASQQQSVLVTTLRHQKEPRRPKQKRKKQCQRATRCKGSSREHISNLWFVPSPFGQDKRTGTRKVLHFSFSFLFLNSFRGEALLGRLLKA